MRILVTGADGQLGRCLRDVSVVSTDEYIFTDVDDFDICDREAVDLMLKVNNFDIVINCAAFTDVERSERQEDIAMRINSQAVGNLARAAKDNEVTLFHISTDYIFDGKGNSPIPEEATPNPLGAYGRTKLAGENAIIESGCKALVFRTAWLYSEYGHNFVKTMLRLSLERDSLSVVYDQIGSPTYARDLAETIVAIISHHQYQDNEGIYNFTDLGVCSWFDLATMTVKLIGNTTCKIRPCNSIEWPSEVKRPTFSVLDKSKIMNTFGIEIPYWLDSLKNCINRLNQLKDD